MIELNDISFSYADNQPVLDNISFSQQKGETLGVVGVSGCGKSTLLRIIASILPSEDAHKLKGHIQIEQRTPDEYRKTGNLSFMFQEATLMPNLTVEQNINFPQQIRGVKDSSKTSDLLKTVGLEKFSGFLPKQLSGGMKTRVALARSFITEPELLLLDEPFSALDIAWKSKLYNEIEDLKTRYNTTVILVTHDIQEALLLCDKIIVLKSSGEVMGKEEIQSEMPVEERVSNVSNYLEEVYSRHYIPIQKLIMDDGTSSPQEKSKILKSQANETVDSIHSR